ncbi:MAG: polysaccharide biosynthesis C-terminal domain-containing protein [Bacteroidales bacterium]|nr:polysaccharide biosynthesis C-terminal domain-containing protein [Bacteroidales bacterium]
MIKQIVNTFITKILSGILNLIIAIIISNYLGAEGKGSQGLILTTISVFIILTGIIGSGGLTYLIPRLHFSLLIIPSYLWSITISFAALLFMSITHIVSNEYVTHVVVLTLILSVSSINNSILHAKKSIKEVNYVSLSQVIITLLLILFLIVYKKRLEVNSYITALYFGYGISALLSYKFTWKYYINSVYKFPAYKYFIGIKKHFKYGGYNQLDILAQVLSFRLAYYFLSYFTNISEVGIYSNAVSIIEAIWIISRSIAYVQHSWIVNSKDKKYTIILSLKFIKLAGFLACIAIIILIIIPSGFYEFVFGHEFGSMQKVILFLSPGVLFFSISFIISSYFSGTGKHYINSISSVVGLLVIIISLLILTPAYGIIGAGIAASLSYFATTLIKVLSFIKISKVKFVQFLPTAKDLKEIIYLFKKVTP